MRDREQWEAEEVRRSCGWKGIVQTFKQHLEKWVRFCQVEMEIGHTQQETVKTKAHA